MSERALEESGIPAEECRITVEDALARLPGAAGERFVSVLEHGSLLVEIYAPRDSDPQQPHTRDEVYVIVEGSGTFLNGQARQSFKRGDLLFVPAGIEHRFESFTNDLTTWVIFYGPEGGETGRKPSVREQTNSMEQSFSDITIRAATNEDVEKIMALVFETLREHGLVPDPEVTDADLKDIEVNYFQKGGVFEVIEDGAGNLVGTVGLYSMDNETCELRKMYFAPQVRGRGLGRRVLERAVRIARERGFKRMTLETSSVLEKAIRLYTRFGFKPHEVKHRSRRSDMAYFLDL